MCLSGHAVSLTVTLWTTAKWRSAPAAGFSNRNALSVSYVNASNNSTKLQFIRRLTATCSDQNIENSKNHKKVTLPTITLPKCHNFDSVRRGKICNTSSLLLFDWFDFNWNDILAAAFAAGDAYRYTLQPVYNDIRHTFRCHVRRRVPDDLYQLWFYVSVPGHFETPRVYTTVRPPLPTAGRSRLDSGRFTYDEFLIVEFDAKLRLTDELVIVGRQNSSGDRWSHSLSDVTTSNFTTGGGVVHELSNGVYVMSVEFDEPFAYSTSSWVRGIDYIYFGH